MRAGTAVHDHIYDIIMLWTAWYTWYLIAVFLVVDRLTKHAENQYQTAIENVVDQLKEIIIEEEIKLSENKLTLTDILTREPSRGDYELILDFLTELAQNRFNEYKFLIAKSSDETKDANFLQIVSNWSEDPSLHRVIFEHAVNCNADMRVVREMFADRVARGEVIKLGDDVKVITDDNTGNPPTGVSPINSGLEGGEIAFIISFIKYENYPEWRVHNFPEVEETNE